MLENIDRLTIILGVNSRFQVRAAICIALLLCPVSLLCLDPANPLDQYISRQWDNRTGLLQNNVTAFAQTPDGYLWVAY